MKTFLCEESVLRHNKEIASRLTQTTYILFNKTTKQTNKQKHCSRLHSIYIYLFLFILALQTL